MPLGSSAPQRKCNIEEGRELRNFLSLVPYAYMLFGVAPILLAEDEENDVVLIRYAFKEAGIGNPLVWVEDGEKALEYLSAEKHLDGNEEPAPCLVITDIKMPKVTGHEVLRWMREHTPDIPAVVLSASPLEADRKLAQELGARAYYVKPVDLTGLVEFARNLAQRWLREQ